jgi:hypothetical protein
MVFARRSKNSGWVRQKSPKGRDQGLLKASAGCVDKTLKLGDAQTFTEVAQGNRRGRVGSKNLFYLLMLKT